MVVRSRRAIALVAVLALPLLLASGGAGAGTKSKGPDLSSPAAITSYLVSKGINPATVTWQTGLNNYAGPSCPGIGWNCTSATNVVQMSTPGGQNKFECTPDEDATTSNDATNECVIVQTEAKNKARCKLRDTGEPDESQTCDITQTGERNSADIDMTIEQKTGPAQTADQNAYVTQTADERNQSQVHQTVKQKTSAGSTQSQDAHQLANVQQEVTGSENFSHVHQSQDQDESGSATTQNQNTGTQPSCTTKNANQCAIVSQDVSDADGGKNESHLHQSTGERQSTKAPSGTQTQGEITNGQQGNIHLGNPPGVGENHDTAHQDLVQRQTSPAGTTTQRQDSGDGRCCGPTSLEGGMKNDEFIHQKSTQSSDEPSAEQDSVLFGEVHELSGDEDSLAPLQAAPASPNNKCKIDQDARINDDSSHESVSGRDLECAALYLTTTCYSGEALPDTCTTSEAPPCDYYCDGYLATLPTSPTFGRDVAMPNYDSEPSDYTDPGGWW
jgi:hypothetical protein